MIRITLDSPALLAVRNWLAGLQPTQRGRSGRRTASRAKFRAEQLEKRTMLDAAAMYANLPDLADASDTGSSTVDNMTYDRTPTFSGSVQGAASQVRLRIDGVRVAVVPVIDFKWNYTVPAEDALVAGLHKIVVLPAAAGRVGSLSGELAVNVVTTPPAASTLILGPQSDSGVRGDGQTIVSAPAFCGFADPGQLVNVLIDGVFAGQVQSDARTGVWLFESPQLANGVHDVTATSVNRAGLESDATSFAVTVNGPRTVMLDASNQNTIELMASHLLGRNSQGFVVTQVHRGALQKWLPVQNAWKTIPARAANATNVLNQTTAKIRTIWFDDLLRWMPSSGDVGTAPAFDIIPLDKANGLTARTPVLGTVPGKVVDGVIGGYAQGLGTTISWKDPTGGGGRSNRYSVELTREDGKTLLYNVPRTVHGVASVEGGRVSSARIWGATKTGAGKAQAYDFLPAAKARDRLS